MRCKFYARGDVLALSATRADPGKHGPLRRFRAEFRTAACPRPVRARRSASSSTTSRRALPTASRSTSPTPASSSRTRSPRCGPGKAENDGFNRLILALRRAPGAKRRCSARSRAIRQQSGLDPSQAVQEQALAAHPNIAALHPGALQARASIPTCRRRWKRGAIAPSKLEVHDRGRAERSREPRSKIARCAASRSLVTAIRRTNYYQPGADGAAEALHVVQDRLARRGRICRRRSRIAKSGWRARKSKACICASAPSRAAACAGRDRRDDFRTEVLDLVKAQQVKNAIIVPVGAKGGFFPKRLPRARRARLSRKPASKPTRRFLRGLLDITDNIVGDDIVAPQRRRALGR